MLAELVNTHSICNMAQQSRVSNPGIKFDGRNGNWNPVALCATMSRISGDIAFNKFAYPGYNQRALS